MNDLHRMPVLFLRQIHTPWQYQGQMKSLFVSIKTSGCERKDNKSHYVVRSHDELNAAKVASYVSIFTIKVKVKGKGKGRGRVGL